MYTALFLATDALSVAVSSERIFRCLVTGDNITGIVWHTTTIQDTMPIQSEVTVDGSRFSVSDICLLIKNISGEYEAEYSCVPTISQVEQPRQLLGCIIVKGKKL